jgi:hypothetical protein
MTFDLKKDPWYIRVNSFEESISVQNWLFEQGIGWFHTRPYTVFGVVGYITNVLSEDGILSGKMCYKSLSTGQPLGYELFAHYKVEEVILPEIREKIEIGGKQYYKEDVEKARKKAITEMESAVKGYGSWEICADLYDAGYRLVGDVK